MDRFRLKIDFSGRFRSVFGRLNEIHFWEQGRTTLKLTENHRTRLVNVLGGAGRGPSGVHFEVSQNALFPTTTHGTHAERAGDS